VPASKCTRLPRSSEREAYTARRKRTRERERKSIKATPFRSSDSRFAKTKFCFTTFSFCIGISNEKSSVHPRSSRDNRNDYVTCVPAFGAYCKFKFQCQLLAGCASSNPKSTQTTQTRFPLTTLYEFPRENPFTRDLKLKRDTQHTRYARA